ncbi:MAG TPA: oligosaccharide flippase family protein [Gemmatimonadaceae bacterium]|nr:oligosaccharide flippase family protein [Gemmatimonadaceae bacterium]
MPASAELIAPAARDAPPRPAVTMSKVGRDTAIYAVGILLNRLASFVMLPLYTRYLTVADYGVIALVETTLDFIAILAGARLTAGLFRYDHDAQSEDERNRITSTSLLLIGAAYAVISAAVCLFAAPLSTLVFHSPDKAFLIRVASAGLFGQSLLLVPLSHARARSRSLLFVGANTAVLVLKIVLNVLFLVPLHLGPLSVFLSNVIAAGAVGAVLVARTIQQVGMHFSGDTARRLARYGLPLVATQVATFVATFGDRYFLQRASDTSTVGLYTLAYQFGFLLYMVGSMPIDQVWEPIRFSLADRPDRDLVLSRAFVYLNILLISTALGITLYVHDVLRAMTQPAFYPAATLVPVILVAYVIQSWTGMQDLGIHVHERTEYITLANWVGGAVALIGYVLLIPRLLGLGAALATIISFTARHLIVRHYSHKLMPVRYDMKPVRRIIAFGATAAIVGLLLPRLDFGFGATLALRTILFAGYVAALWNGRVLTAAERAAVVRFASGLVREARRAIPRQVTSSAE